MRGPSRFLALRNGFQHVSRPGDVREVDLGLDFFFAAQGTRRFCRWRMRFRGTAQVHAHFFRFVVFERTGVRLLLRHPDDRQHVENGFALDFQLSREIVDSNLAHPAFLTPGCALCLHSTLTESVFLTRTSSLMCSRAS
jgi:hypothetical protein